jgi:protein-S-isoprenylcysteine O-methyltransferase Ste14
MTSTTATFIWFAGLVGWYFIRRPFERKARKVGVSKSLMDRQELLLLTCMTIGLFLIPAIYALTGFPASLDRPFYPAIGWLGLVPLVGALWLFRRSHVDLGRNWSVTLKVREDHVLIRAGVYRLVRHPMYSSFFLLGLAQLLLLSNWVAGISGLIGVGLLFAFRVMREERMMLDSFGDEYRAYMASTKRIIPWVL